ncbi:putative N-acetyltransferase 8B [Monodelphis domestica]|uniref:putative N-acetyltransferase 8B n=1 Tax=Monodelphis domestica TaxID=13616 RepID=UPI0004432FBF|nr:putative N-acetyltransferase 8B [Monodelphis domestica]XP_007496993.1 putative N-acetyltransferase 8B [Monodelphis domestica]XP_007496995.1 putative N-acetyltransferase 8B [Monodelphis domestica]
MEARAKDLADGDRGVQVQVRPMAPGDEAATRGLLAVVSAELGSAVGNRMVWRPWFLLLLGCGFALLATSSRSLLLPLLVLALLLAVGHPALAHMWSLYVHQDMSLGLGASGATSFRFWVAVDTEGSVVGTVGVSGIGESGDGKLELRSLAVGPKHRGRGVGRALCQAVLAFARDYPGCQIVVLDTHMLHGPAQRLFSSLGFHPGPARLQPTLSGFLANLPVIRYHHALAGNSTEEDSPGGED